MHSLKSRCRLFLTYILLALCALVFTTSLPTNSSASETLSLERTPNGLVIFKENTNHLAMGFVVGQFIYTAGHVLTSSNLQIFVYQDDNLIELEPGARLSTEFHPYYIDQRLRLDDVDLEGLEEHDLNRLKIFQTKPFDIGRIKFTTPIHSDFLFEDHRNSSSPSDTSLYVFGLTKHKRIEAHLPPEGFLPVTMTFDRDWRRFDVDYSNYEKMTFLSAYDGQSLRGDSGAPLVSFSSSRKSFEVIGWVQGTWGNPIVLTGASPQNPTLVIYSLVNGVGPWIHNLSADPCPRVLEV